MKPVLGPAVAAVLLAVAGGALWAAADVERRLVAVHTQLATLQYDAAGTAAGGVDESLGIERRIPGVGAVASADARDARAVAAYWTSDYDAIAPRRDAAGLVTESDSTILLLWANAAFRRSRGSGDRTDTLRRLDEVVKNYTAVLKAETANCGAGLPACGPRARDAAYNYELALRTREATALMTPAAFKAAAARPTAAVAARDDTDLPSGPTVHGHPGAPPAAADMGQFKIVIPKRSGEREEDEPSAGEGGEKVRKG